MKKLTIILFLLFSFTVGHSITAGIVAKQVYEDR